MADKKGVQVDSMSSRGKQSKNKLLVAGAAVIGVTVMFNMIIITFFGEEKAPEPEPQAEEVNLTPEGVEEESFQSQVQSDIRGLKDFQDNMKQQMEETQERLDRMQESREELGEQVDNGFGEMMNKLDSMEQSQSEMKEKVKEGAVPPPSQNSTKQTIPAVPPPPPGNGEVEPPSYGDEGSTGSTGSQSDSESSDEPMVLTPDPDDSEKVEMTVQREENPYAGWLSPGFVNATLLTGVQAGTGSSAQSNPHPVMLRIQGNVTMPGSAQYELKGCFATATMYGDARTHRAYGDLATISCVDKRNHLVMEETVTGWIVDSDGEKGLRGKLVEKRGAALAKATLASVMQGMSDAFSNAQGTAFESVTGGGSILQGDDALKSSGLQGLSGGAEKLAQFYLEEAERLFPVVVVPPNRKVTLVFSKGKSLKWNDAGSLFREVSDPE